MLTTSNRTRWQKAKRLFVYKLFGSKRPAFKKRPDGRPIYAGQDGQSAGVTVYKTIKRNDLVVKSEI
jgi:hypothetical protein